MTHPFPRLAETTLVRRTCVAVGIIVVDRWRADLYRIATYAPGRHKPDDCGLDPERQEFAKTIEDARAEYQRQRAAVLDVGWSIEAEKIEREFRPPWPFAHLPYVVGDPLCELYVPNRTAPVVGWKVGDDACDAHDLRHAGKIVKITGAAVDLRFGDGMLAIVPKRRLVRAVDAGH